MIEKIIDNLDFDNTSKFQIINKKIYNLLNQELIKYNPKRIVINFQNSYINRTLSIGEDNQVKLCDIISASCDLMIQNWEGINSINFSPNGTNIVVDLNKDISIIFDYRPIEIKFHNYLKQKAPKIIIPLNELEAGQSSSSFSKDGSKILLIHENSDDQHCIVKIQDSTNYNIINTFQFGNQQSHFILMNEDGSNILVTHEFNIVIYNTYTHNSNRIYKNINLDIELLPIFSLQSPNYENVLIQAQYQNLQPIKQTISIYKIQNLEKIIHIHQFNEVVIIDFSPNGEYLLTGENNGICKVRMANTGLLIQSFIFTVQYDDIDPIKISNTSKQLLIHYNDSIQIRDLKTGNILQNFSIIGKNYTNVTFLADDKKIVSGDELGQLNVQDLETGECVNNFKAHDGEIIKVITSPKYK